MKPIDPKSEKKILKDVVRQMADFAATERKQARLQRVILASGAIALTIAFFLAINEIVHPFIVAVIAAMAGTLIGFSLLFEMVLKQWPVTRQHVDMESVRRRLDELGA